LTNRLILLKAQQKVNNMFSKNEIVFRSNEINMSRKGGKRNEEKYWN